MFKGSILDNIIYGAPGYEPEELRRVIKTVEMEAWIEKLPNGINTDIDDGEAILSGGERQRIAIVRALMHKPQMIGVA
jgi:ABC-type multidrug transport system fused ATPase/permease subunit